MREEIEKYELIEQYLAGNLTNDELLQFEARLGSDADLAAEVERHRSLNDFVFDKSLLDIKDQLTHIHNAHNTGTGNRIWKNRGLYFIAPIALLTILAVLLLQQKNTVNKADTTTIHPPPQPLDISPEKVEILTEDSVIEDPANDHAKSATKNTTKTKVEPQQTIPLHPTETVQETNDSIEIRKEDIPAHIEEPEEIAEIKNNTLQTTGTILQEKEAPFDCSKTVISANIKLGESCEHKASGSIQIDKSSIEGGYPPYEVSIDGEVNFYHKFQFVDLYSKIYTISIRDKNKCLTQLGNFVLKSVDCTYEYAFAPDEGERWEIPTKETPGNIKIYNKVGQVVFEEVFDFAGPYQWDGRNLAGDGLPMGAYSFVLELEGEYTLVGSVTIIR